MKRIFNPFRKYLVLIAVASSPLVAAAPAKASVFDLSYSGPNGLSGNFIFYVDPATLRATSLISGEQNGVPATALLAPGTINNNDNYIAAGYGSTPIFDAYGIAFRVGSNYIQIYSTGHTNPPNYDLASWTTGNYTEQATPIGGSAGSAATLTFFSLSAPGPAPGAGLYSLCLLALGLVGKGWRIVSCARRRLTRDLDPG
jgi:hypothetical protein